MFFKLLTFNGERETVFGNSIPSCPLRLSPVANTSFDSVKNKVCVYPGAILMIELREGITVGVKTEREEPSPSCPNFDDPKQQTLFLPINPLLMTY